MVKIGTYIKVHAMIVMIKLIYHRNLVKKFENH